MSINIRKSDVIWSYLSLIVFNAVNLLLLPFMLKYLTTEELGLWYTYTAISGLVVLLDFGFKTTLSRNVTQVWSGADSLKAEGLEKNENKKAINYSLFNDLFQTTKTIYFALGIVVCAILFIIGTPYIYFISIDKLNIVSVLLSWFFYAFAVFLDMKYSYWNSILTGIGAIREYQKNLVVSKSVQFLLTVIGLFFGLGLLGASLGYLFSIIVNRVLAYYSFKNFNKNKRQIIKKMKDKISVKKRKNIAIIILPNTYKQGLISISNYINMRSITIMSSAYLGLSASASIGLTLQVINLIISVGNSFFNTYLPQFSYFRIKGKYKDMYRKLNQALVINYLIILIGFLGVLFMGDFFLEFINSNSLLIDKKYLVVMMIYLFLYNNHSLFATFIGTENKLPHYKSFILSSVVIVIIQIILMNYYNKDLWTLILPILIVQLVYNNWKWPIYVMKGKEG